MANTVQIKQINVDRVRTMLKTKASFTKIDLAAATGLSVATCGNILKELLLSGEALEIEHAGSTGGRPSRRFVYNSDFSFVLALYVRKEGESESLVYRVSNLVGDTIEENGIQIKHLNIGTIDESVNRLTNQYPNIKALSIGVPGVVSNGIIGICDIASLCNQSIQSYFEEKFNLTVVAVNDVNCTAYGFFNREGYEEGATLAYIYYPARDGPGAGIIVGNRVLDGASSFAGEVSYLPHYVFDQRRTNDVKKDHQFAQSVAKAIIAINSVINPKTVVLSGVLFSKNTLSTIRELIDVYIPKPHVPNIIFEPDIHPSYICGLTTMALDRLTYNYDIVKKY